MTDSGMTLRELLHDATSSGVELDVRVKIWAYDINGEYVEHVITGLTSDRDGQGASRITMDIEPAP
jgi:hypothetical protein